jgi:A/G-specific adenine glycosylase
MTKRIVQKKEIETRLLRWFKKNGRDLPWRKTTDPYAIWVSEIMLQQTQVITVIPYYQKFLKSFPTVHHLARNNVSNVLKVWEGLGYYSRARNLHRASQIVLDRFRGIIPNDLKDLVSLPGIGRSTAGAILSFAFHKDAPILDANAKRVISRLFAVSDNQTAGRTDDLLWKISESLLPEGYSNPFNQALMDLGSMICTVKEPACACCPLRGVCKARILGKPEDYPSKRIRKMIPHVGSVSAVIKRDGKVLLRQRPPSGLLGGLWEFPNWRTKEKQSSLRPRLRNHIRKDIGITANVKELIGTFRQTFSHFKLTLQVYHCQAINGKGKGKWVRIKDLRVFPMSRIHRRIAEKTDGETQG